jgi:hypothetical protein
MGDRISYTPLGESGAGPVPADYFMIDNLLDSRMSSGHPSNGDFYDEDVNVYLAGLLTGMVGARGETAGLVVPYDADLFELVRREPDPRVNFRRYRVNADFILVSLGLFAGPAPRLVPPAALRISNETYSGRGAAYYAMAASYARETFRGPSAIGEVMEKLSRGFEIYVRILSVMKSERLDLLPRLSDGELFHLQRSVMAEEKRSLIPAARDEFLDAWSRHRDEGSASSLAALEQAAGRLRELDPEFRLEIDDLKPGNRDGKIVS